MLVQERILGLSFFSQNPGTAYPFLFCHPQLNNDLPGSFLFSYENWDKRDLADQSL